MLVAWRRLHTLPMQASPATGSLRARACVIVIRSSICSRDGDDLWCKTVSIWCNLVHSCPAKGPQKVQFGAIWCRFFRTPRTPLGAYVFAIKGFNSAAPKADTHLDLFGGHKVDGGQLRFGGQHRALRVWVRFALEDPLLFSTVHCSRMWRREGKRVHRIGFWGGCGGWIRSAFRETRGY